MTTTPRPRTRRGRPPLSEAALETYFRTAVKKLLRGHPVKLIPVEAGMPDRIVLLPGGHVRLVELKTDHGGLSQLQKVWLARMRKLGFHATVVTGTAGVDAWIADTQRELFS